MNTSSDPISTILSEINNVVKETTNINLLAEKWAKENNNRQKAIYAAALAHISHGFLKKKMDTKDIDYDQDSLDKLQKVIADNITEIKEHNSIV